MKNLTSLADRLSGLNLRSRSRTGAGLRRRRSDRRWQAAAAISLLEERCMLSGPDLGGIILKPGDHPYVQPADVMYQGDNNLKTITIHNNSDQPIFPFVNDVNIGIDPNTKLLYDPHDFPFKPAVAPKKTEGQEYRLYAGYAEDGQNYLGVPPKSSITLTLPMVFWNAGTLQVVADTPDTIKRFLVPLEPGGNKDGRPFLYNKDDAKEAVAPATATVIGPDGSPVQGATGIMLLYHTTNQLSKGVVADAPGQLVEFTDRDISNAAENSVDYDISYINHAYLPVAIEADKAGVGYVGTFDSTQTFQAAEAALANGSILNGYFGGKGWPIYYTQDPNVAPPAGALIKLVGTQNIFSDNTAASSYDLLHTMLSSSGGNLATKGVLKPFNGDYAEKDLTNLWFGWLNYYFTETGTQMPEALSRLENQTEVKLNPVTITPDSSQMWTTVTGSVNDTQFANAFANTVYQVMNAFSGATNISWKDPAQPALRTFMGDIIGNTISFAIHDITTPAGVLLTQEEVALLQGEPNTQAQVLATGQDNYALPNGANGHYVAYPTPAGPTAPANEWAVGKYNLNPFVWFVHKYLGAFSYGFSVDDEYGNVLVKNASGFEVAVGGDGGIPVKTPYVKGT